MPYPVTPTREGMISITSSLTLISSFCIHMFIDQTNCNCKENDTKHNIQNSRSSIKYILQPLSSCNRISKTRAFVIKSSILPAIATASQRIEKMSLQEIFSDKCFFCPVHTSQEMQPQLPAYMQKIANLLRYQIQHRHNSNINNTDQSSFPFLFHIWIYKTPKQIPVIIKIAITENFDVIIQHLSTKLI